MWGSLFRSDYGAAPLIQFNEYQGSSIDPSQWLKPDIALFERLLGVGFFHYGPRLWMLGEIEPLKNLQKPRKRDQVIRRILKEYPVRTITKDQALYRVRVNPSEASDPNQYDSPPAHIAGGGRLDSPGKPVLYCSTDLDICLHECRVSAEDDTYLATLNTTREFRLLDLSILLKEEDVTEFESLDMSVHMLFLAGKHAYAITRAISEAAFDKGYDGIIYPSYFSLLRIGLMPFPTILGMSPRRMPQFQDREQEGTIPNIAVFGRPVETGTMRVTCINKLILSRVHYDFHFGPVQA